MVKTPKLNSRHRIAGPKPEPSQPAAPVRLDLGCGTHKRNTDNQGQPQTWVGVDSISFPGVDVVMNLTDKWPWKDSTVEEAHTSHCLEHFGATGRIHFINELYRVLKPGAKCSVIVPHWASCRAYGDPTHQWPPISEMWFYYLKKEWRISQAPHTDSQNWNQGFKCDFDAVWGYHYHPEVAQRNQEYQQYAQNFLKEAIWDLQATLTALKPTQST
jgi:hypothetical protein